MSVASTFASFFTLSGDKKEFVVSISYAVGACYKLIKQELRRPGQTASLPKSSPSVIKGLRQTLRSAIITLRQGYDDAWAPGLIGAPFKFYMPLSIYQFLTNRGDDPDFQRILDELTAMNNALEVISDAQYEQLEKTMVQPQSQKAKGGLGEPVTMAALAPILIGIVVLIGLAVIAWSISEAVKAYAATTRQYSDQLETVRQSCVAAQCTPKELAEMMDKVPKPPDANSLATKAVILGGIVVGGAVLMYYGPQIKEIFGMARSELESRRKPKQLSGYDDKSLWD